MTERQNDDPFRVEHDESGTFTDGSASTKGGHADQGEAAPGTREDAGGRTGRIGNTGLGPDWMQDQPGKGREVNREAAGVPTDDEREKIR